MPWAGYIYLMYRSKKIILLDDVQFAKRSWQQRNQIKTPNGLNWLTVPVKTKGMRFQAINQVRIDLERNFQNDHLRTIEHNYKGAQYFHSLFPRIKELIGQNNELLIDLNISFIEYFKEFLSIKTEIIKASELNAEGKRENLLLNLCKSVKATEYISPPGSQAYLEESTIFGKSGISVKYFQYECSTYPQLYGDFVPYASIIDLVMNCGEMSALYMKRGIS